MSIPAAALLAWLSMFQLYAVGFLVGTLNVIFGIAYQAFLSPLVGRVGAGFAFLTSGIQPVGMVLGGFLGQTIGIRPTMIAGVFAVLLIAVALLASPIGPPRTLAHA